MVHIRVQDGVCQARCMYKKLLHVQLLHLVMCVNHSHHILSLEFSVCHVKSGTKWVLFPSKF